MILYETPGPSASLRIVSLKIVRHQAPFPQSGTSLSLLDYTYFWCMYFIFNFTWLFFHHMVTLDSMRFFVSHFCVIHRICFITVLLFITWYNCNLQTRPCCDQPFTDKPKSGFYFAFYLKSLSSGGCQAQQLICHQGRELIPLLGWFPLYIDVSH